MITKPKLVSQELNNLEKHAMNKTNASVRIGRRLTIVLSFVECIDYIIDNLYNSMDIISNISNYIS